MSSNQQAPQQSLTIFYDGYCPVCTQYVRYTRLGKSVSKLALRNLREEPEKVSEFKARGLDVNEGMIVDLDGAIYHGAAAVHILALLSTPVGLFNRCNRLIFSHHWLAHLLYPVLAAGRNILLFLLGRKKINIRQKI
jgi:predicted DCC family thiol-disulfide oxidoreductase YuxK